MLSHGRIQNYTCEEFPTAPDRFPSHPQPVPVHAPTAPTPPRPLSPSKKHPPSLAAPPRGLHPRAMPGLSAALAACGGGGAWSTADVIRAGAPAAYYTSPREPARATLTASDIV